METLNLDKKTYKTKNHYKTKTPKSQIVIGSTLRKDSNHITRLQHKELGTSKEWSMFTITREGKVYQHFDSNYYSDFLKNKSADKKIISILLENMVYIYKYGDSYYNFIREKCDKSNVEHKKWMEFEYWEKYPPKQMESLANLCVYLCNKHKISKNVVDFHHHHKDIIRFDGITIRGNHINGITDNNPLFDLGRLQKIIDLNE